VEAFKRKLTRIPQNEVEPKVIQNDVEGTYAQYLNKGSIWVAIYCLFL